MSQLPLIDAEFRYHPPAEPPQRYTVIDMAGGWWQKRRKVWREWFPDMGVSHTAELWGTQHGLTPSATQSSGAGLSGLSSFSPTLAEWIICAYSSPGDLVADPFAGGPVRGVVSCVTGRRYYGMDIRDQQTLDNNAYARNHNIEAPVWITGASQLHLPPPHDLLFTCPPYHDREVYSNGLEDLSNMDAATFDGEHRRIIREWSGLLRPGGFAVWVVGWWRDKSGGVADFPGQVIGHAQSAGLLLWDKLILREPLVTAQMRWQKPWESSRRSTRTHQELLVFKKTKATTGET